MPSNLCSTIELQARLHDPELKIIDASWAMPSANIDSHQGFLKRRIPGARFFDIDKVCDQESDLPHMLPGEKDMSRVCTELGLAHDSDVVVYDTAGLFSAARVWWMFKVFGHNGVRVLDGGMPAWLEHGHAMESGPSAVTSAASTPYIATINETFLADRGVLLKNTEQHDFLVLDARSQGRFCGVDPEPRKGLRSGHMPNSRSLPYERLIDNNRLKPVPELKTIFAEFGLDPSQDTQAVITTCGSGVTAAIITLAMVECGFSMHRLYDGAWAEWVSSDDAIILQGL